ELRRRGTRRADLVRRNLDGQGLRECQPGSFVGEKEKGLVPPNWPAQHSAKVVVMLWRSRKRRSGGVIEPVVRVHHRVPEVIESRSMKGIRSRTRGQNHLAPGSAAKLRGKRGSLDTELLQGVDRHQAARPTQCAERLCRSRSRLP